MYVCVIDALVFCMIFSTFWKHRPVIMQLFYFFKSVIYQKINIYLMKIFIEIKI